MKSEKIISNVLPLLLYVLALLPSTGLAKIEVVLGNVPLDNNANLATLPSVASSEVIISRDQYVISYNKDRRSPNWVAWKVEANQLGNAARTNNFVQDAELEQYLEKTPNSPAAVTPSDYKGSCFDRGHQAPSADRTDTVENNQSTFVMSNMIPQTPYLNRFLWEQLEHQTREYVRQGNKVYVIAGPVYDQNFGSIGPKGDIPVPSKVFKIVIVVDAQQKSQVISVMMPNILKDGENPTNKETLCKDTASPGRTSTNEWQQYKVSVQDIERISGVQFQRMAP